MFKRFCMMAVLTAVMCSGCLSRSKGPSTLPTTKLAAIAWIEFAGLTQDDLRERIGLARISQTLATAARIENGDIHSEVWALYFLRDACGEAPEGYNARPEVSQNNATLHLVNGHITRMHAPKLQAGPPADADNPFTITCHYLRSPTLGDSLNTGQTIGLLPLLPIFAVSKGVGDAAAERRYEAFPNCNSESRHPADTMLGSESTPVTSWHSQAEAKPKYASIRTMEKTSTAPQQQPCEMGALSPLTLGLRVFFE